MCSSDLFSLCDTSRRDSRVDLGCGGESEAADDFLGGGVDDVDVVAGTLYVSPADVQVSGEFGHSGLHRGRHGTILGSPVDGYCRGVVRVLSIAAGVHPDLAPHDMVRVAAEAGWPACGIWFDGTTWSDTTTREVRRRLDDTGVIGQIGRAHV